ncbi:MAG: efflux RND transporter permease subunit [Planctomycetota bacterium]|jgi:Cu(I)/Ag(I) efflux system membrane protein CusA/SilA
MASDSTTGRLDGLIRFCLENRFLVVLATGLLLAWGVLVAPFDWQIPGFPRDPVPVDAIPDTADNQQIVFTEWTGRSPQDVEDQISYPLTVALLGVPGVKNIRSNSMFGFSSIAVIFEEDVEFYWSRSRILEKLASLPAGTLPEGVQPGLGPDATALGQVFWYTLEGQDESGQPTGGWDLQELRSAQDWYLRYALSSVPGVAEVASVGGFVQEYQIDVDPNAMRAHGVSLNEVFAAIRNSNVDVGARTIEVNRADYVVRGLGFLRSVADIEATVVKVNDNLPILVKHVARVSLGPALRRGVLDRGGAEAVGGVVVARFGENPLAVIDAVKAKLEEIAPGMPSKVLDDGTSSRLAAVPFYDRSGLIMETLDTLSRALSDEILVTIIVILVMLGHLGSALLISGVLPLAVLICFIAMKQFGVDANVVALSGIAIAIGTIVDVGVVMTENILKHSSPGQSAGERLQAIRRAANEVGGAVLTAVLTTVISFLPVFTMIGPEGKLFKPLAFTKTFALIASIAVALTVIPALAHFVLGRGRRNKTLLPSLPAGIRRHASMLLAILVGILLALAWEPMGPERNAANLTFTGIVLGGILGLFWLFHRGYEGMLRLCLRYKLFFLSIPLLLIFAGAMVWRGLGKEFMPPLDEGSFLLMPVTADHASIGEAIDLLHQQGKLLEAIPEVESAVGKIGRAESPLDPAPLSMFETVVNYHPEYVEDENGDRHRQWRDHIRSPDDIWEEIANVAAVPGLTKAGLGMPIDIRRVMLQTGMRGSMGVKVLGDDLQDLEVASRQIEDALRLVSVVDGATVNSTRIIGRPYLEIDIDRPAIARFGMSIRQVQDVIEVAIGGKRLTTTVEGRERYPVRVRYMRELRDHIDSLRDILVPAADGAQIPLGQLAEIRYTSGPQSIKSEDGFQVAYVTFDKKGGLAEVDVVEACQAFLAEKIAGGELQLPPGISYRFAGDYENQLRAAEKLRVVLPLALFLIFFILYLQFRSVSTTLIVFSGVFVAWAGGFIMIGLYGQDWFLNVNLMGTNLRDLFQVQAINLSVAVWVGFLALFGIATDDGVIMATYLKQRFAGRELASVEEIHEEVVAAGKRRIRPCLMTVATTILALLPVLTSTGRGSDVMVPMAIPSFGGMCVVLITVFVVPTLYCMVEEFRLQRRAKQGVAG